MRALKKSGSVAPLAVAPGGDRSTMPRLPQRAAGRLRYEKLLEATDQLLSERDAGDISLHDIADRAKVPSASVYHFLPSMTAALVALAQRYLERLHSMLDEPLDHASLKGWQDVAAIKAEAGRQFYESHIVAKKLFLGSEYSWQVRQQEALGNRLSAHHVTRDYNRHFVMPGIESLVGKVEIAIGLMDATWSMSYIRHGCVTDDYAEEANRAYIGYMRSYIAEHVEKRPEPLPEDPLWRPDSARSPSGPRSPKGHGLCAMPPATGPDRGRK
jgi:AcrR family transcriptional regulator